VLVVRKDGDRECSRQILFDFTRPQRAPPLLLLLQLDRPTFNFFATGFRMVLSRFLLVSCFQVFCMVFDGFPSYFLNRIYFYLFLKKINLNSSKADHFVEILAECPCVAHFC
jgi:hypothetical protein